MQPLELSCTPHNRNRKVHKCETVQLCTRLCGLQPDNIVWSEKSVWHINSMRETPPSPHMQPLEFAALQLKACKCQTVQLCTMFFFESEANNIVSAGKSVKQIDSLLWINDLHRCSHWNFPALPVAETKKHATAKLCNYAPGFSNCWPVISSDLTNLSSWSIAYSMMKEITHLLRWCHWNLLHFSLQKPKSMQVQNCATMHPVFVNCRPIILSDHVNLSSRSMACHRSPICTDGAIRSSLHTPLQTLKACNCETV